ncbi:hypothetical protein PALB_36310 [Pseudoalteromonas luteoviolacea B = ATCC 29581]|nr:hypothetical protein PALB_36310 [Pseudoalteromonas luteoviolacea B = ATCC 29581]
MDALILLVSCVSAYLTPIALIAKSKRTKGHEKNTWLLATLLFSWVALLLYVTVVPANQKCAVKSTRHRLTSDV